MLKSQLNDDSKHMHTLTTIGALVTVNFQYQKFCPRLSNPQAKKSTFELADVLHNVANCHFVNIINSILNSPRR